MKNIKIKTLVTMLAIWLTNMEPLWAATPAREDNSNLFVWIFLAFCALIVVAQLVPALMVLLGFAKGVKKEGVPALPEAVNDLVAEEVHRD